MDFGYNLFIAFDDILHCNVETVDWTYDKR